MVNVKRQGRPGFVVDEQVFRESVNSWVVANGPFKSRNALLKSFANSSFALNAVLTSGNSKPMTSQSIGLWATKLNIELPLVAVKEPVLVNEKEDDYGFGQSDDNQ
jgi:hypothetical protein